MDTNGEVVFRTYPSTTETRFLAIDAIDIFKNLLYQKKLFFLFLQRLKSSD